MDINSLFSGLIGAVLGAVITYALQHRLVKMQIAATEKTQAEFMALSRCRLLCPTVRTAPNSESFPGWSLFEAQYPVCRD